MEFPYELLNLLSIDNKGFSIIESSIINYINNTEKYYLSQIINSLGELSNGERHLNKQIITFESFFNSENKKTIIIKVKKDIIIGFISYEFLRILLRNEFNLNYFSKILLTITDFCENIL